MTGYTRNDVTNEIADTNVINAAPLNGEFNAIEAAFDEVTGHNHDGTTAEGAPITVLGPTQDVIATANVLRPKTDNLVDLGTASFEFKDLYIDGTANIDSLVADAGTVGGSPIATISNTHLSYPTRAALLASPPVGVVNGQIVTAGGLEYVRVSSSTKIPDFAGWEANGRWTPGHLGAKGDGATDDTAILITFFQLGGDLYVGPGNYRIVGPGPDSGGVYATVTSNTRVYCDPGARFTASGLDNDMIRLSVPAGGAGLPAEGITVEWYGGYFDQSNQKVSTVVPFLVNYPPPGGLVGVSATCDGLSIYGSYIDGTEKAGIRRAVVSGVTTYGGTHWQVAGGDCGVFVGGCEEQVVEKCTGIGNRDLAIYMSGGNNGLMRCRSVIRDNLAINCFHGGSIKRSADYSQIVNNHAENCVRGFIVDKLVGNGFSAVVISMNSGNNCGSFVRVRDTVGFSICENHFTNIGAYLADGTTVEPLADSYGIGDFQDSEQGTVANNTLSGRATGLEIAYPGHKGALFTQTTASKIKFCDNLCNNYRILGQDLGDFNIFIDNVNFNFVTSSSITILGANSFEQRRNPATNVIEFNTPVGFSDGSVTEPVIMRRGQPNTGLYFAADQIRFTAAANDRLVVGPLGVGFQGTPANFPVWVAPSGTASRATFDTATVTTAQLAQRVKSLIDDLKAFGLFS